MKPHLEYSGGVWSFAVSSRSVAARIADRVIGDDLPPAGRSVTRAIDPDPVYTRRITLYANTTADVAVLRRARWEVASDSRRAIGEALQEARR